MFCGVFLIARKKMCGAVSVGEPNIIRCSLTLLHEN